MKKGSFVTYMAGSLPVLAIVRRLHRDGSATVEARWFLRDGRPAGGYLGYLYRLDASSLRAA